ncbi:hypothetical protein [Paenibacillus polymyxa]|uniref:hypothetical protein n=1 Tax=Paenibacillus polymyxa TaxID=1406 RepID=UPI001C9DFDC6|nr:hypothetical protein [Paenibacillus polymyxa]MBY7736735.1 hypothetical protein [Paenibacillus polymyxa]
MPSELLRTVIEGYHEAHCDFHDCEIGPHVPSHEAYIDPSDPGIIPPQPFASAPNGFHWALNPRHADEPGGHFHNAEWVLHHEHH